MQKTWKLIETGTWVLIWEYSVRANQWISSWQSKCFFKNLHPWALNESSISIESVKMECWNAKHAVKKWLVHRCLAVTILLSLWYYHRHLNRLPPPPPLNRLHVTLPRSTCPWRARPFRHLQFKMYLIATEGFFSSAFFVRHGRRRRLLVIRSGCVKIGIVREEGLFVMARGCVVLSGMLSLFIE